MPNIILDRDGVINVESELYIKSPAEWQAIPGSLEAISALNQRGYNVYIATNQSGIARKLYDRATLERIHDKMHQALEAVGGRISGVVFCPHHPDEKCPCRKPEPGMLHQIEAHYGVDLTQTYFIGDSVTDIQAGRAAGCLPALVLTGKGAKYRHHPEAQSIPIFNDLRHAVSTIIQTEK